MKPTQQPKLNLERAIRARQVLLLRPPDESSLRVSLERVYTPTDQALKTLADKPPPVLRCLRGEELDQKKVSGGKFVYVDLVLPDTSVIYLGAVSNKTHAHWCWQDALKNYAKRGVDCTELRRRGPQTILREWHVCSIPVPMHHLSDEVVAGAIHRYITQIAPGLRDSSINFSWLPRETMFAIERDIFAQAKKRSKNK